MDISGRTGLSQGYPMDNSKKDIPGISFLFIRQGKLSPGYLFLKRYVRDNFPCRMTRKDK